MFRKSESPYTTPIPTGPVLPPSIESTTARTQGKQSASPNSRRMSPAFLLLGVALSWFFIWQPLAEAMRTGHLHYYLQGILLGPIFFYLGIVGLFTDISDGQIRQTNPRGQRKLTAKGKKMVLGSVAVVAVTAAGWFWLLNVLGFQI